MQRRCLGKHGPPRGCGAMHAGHMARPRLGDPRAWSLPSRAALAWLPAPSRRVRARHLALSKQGRRCYQPTMCGAWRPRGVGAATAAVWSYSGAPKLLGGSAADESTSAWGCGGQRSGPSGACYGACASALVPLHRGCCCHVWSAGVRRQVLRAASCKALTSDDC